MFKKSGPIKPRSLNDFLNEKEVISPRPHQPKTINTKNTYWVKNNYTHRRRRRRRHRHTHTDPFFTIGHYAGHAPFKRAGQTSGQGGQVGICNNPQHTPSRRISKKRPTGARGSGISTCSWCHISCQGEERHHADQPPLCSIKTMIQRGQGGPPSILGQKQI